MCSDDNYKQKDTVRNKIYVVTHKNWRWGSLKILGGIMLILFRFNFTTNKELDKLSKQPASRMVILLLLKFLKWTGLQQQQQKLSGTTKKNTTTRKLPKVYDWAPVLPLSNCIQLYKYNNLSALFLQLQNKNNT